MARLLGFFVFPEFDLLDLSGPLAVFADANGAAPGAYGWEVISLAGGPVRSSNGVEVATVRSQARSYDTLIIMGGAPEAFRQPMEATADHLRTISPNVRRLASVCTGAFLLSAAGQLAGRRATTHWRYAAELQARSSDIRVDPDKIFIQDGPIWTSAGATAGIDLALAMVEEDLGLEVSRQVARGLVVYHRRLGGQSQYSALLELDAPSDRIRRVMGFIRENLSAPLSVGRLAEVARLSERQFARAFTAETGLSPAKAVERMRVETARPLVEEGRSSLDEIARSVGFTDPDRMREAFLRCYGQAPQSVRRSRRGDRGPDLQP